MVNPITKQVVTKDGYLERYNRMRTRILEWARQIQKLDEPAFYKMISLTYDVKGTVIKATNWLPNDIRDFEVELRRYVGKNFPGIIIWGFAWVGEVQPNSKNYHYHLMVATSKKLHFPRGVIEKFWAKGFIKMTPAKTIFYLVSYVKKKDQKDYFWFPFGARGFSVWIAPWAMSDGKRLKSLLRYNSLKNWQFEYLAEHSKGDDLEAALDLLSGVRAPPSNWVWVGSWVKKEKADAQVAEILANFEKEGLENAQGE